MIHEVKELVGSSIKALELFLLTKDRKPVVRLLIDKHKESHVIQWAERQELNYAFSNFKIRKIDTAMDSSKSYSDLGLRFPAASKEPGLQCMYIAKDKNKADEANRLEESSNHHELGLALGYPPCCARFFEQNFTEQSKKSNDYTLLTLKNSEDYRIPFQTNVAARHFDCALLSHFPCSFDCQPSILLAKENLQAVKKDHADVASEIQSMLSNPIIYTETNGVFMLKNPMLKEKRLYYKGMLSTAKNQIYSMLKLAEHINIENKNKIRVNGLDIKNIGVICPTPVT